MKKTDGCNAVRFLRLIILVRHEPLVADLDDEHRHRLRLVHCRAAANRHGDLNGELDRLGHGGGPLRLDGAHHRGRKAAERNGRFLRNLIGGLHPAQAAIRSGDEK